MTTEIKCRLAHFFWLDKNPVPKDFDFKKFASMHTWLLHHCEWNTTLYTNTPFEGKLFEYCRGLGMNVERIERVPNQVNISAEVDYHKWRVLYERGGMVLDISDTITLANFDALYDTANRLLWSHYTIGVKQMGNGWLCINKPKGDICRLVISRLQNTPKVQPVGAWEAASFALSRTANDVSRNPTDQKVVFGAHFTKMRQMIWDNKLEIPLQCKQMHFYYGNVLTNEMQLQKQEFLENYYKDLPNWTEQKNIITQTYARSLAAKGIDFVPVL